jgi:hypothetical protein
MSDFSPEPKTTAMSNAGTVVSLLYSESGNHMRNLFDQYTHPENRLTHALLSCLSRDTGQLKRFVSWAVGKSHSGKALQISEQSLPGEAMDLSEDDAERRGLPDGCVSDGTGWALLIESKFAARVSSDQLRRQLRTAARHGLDKSKLLVLTAVEVRQRLPAGTLNRRWSEVYQWLMRERRRSPWMQIAAEYLEVAEVREANQEYLKEGTLTVFTGIPFGADDPYSYPQAKRLLRLLLDELRNDRRLRRGLGTDPNGRGRGAITGRAGQGVWDFISLKPAPKTFTQFPHLTIGIRDVRFEVYVTLPNGIRSSMRNNVLGTSYEQFEDLIGAVTRLLGKALRKYPGAVPMMVLVQRRYLTQRSPALIDGILRFDPRTAFSDGANSAVKHQPQWLRAVYDLLRHRRSNLQLQIGADFHYDTCGVVATPKVKEAAVDVWLACKPVIQAATA